VYRLAAIRAAHLTISLQSSQVTPAGESGAHNRLLSCVLDTRDHPLTTTTAPSPSRLIVAMEPLTITRCAVANEYLRRRKQPFCDATNRPCPEHHGQFLSVTSEMIPIMESKTEQRYGDFTVAQHFYCK
jgi:hypothetical protein